MSAPTPERFEPSDQESDDLANRNTDVPGQNSDTVESVIDDIMALRQRIVGPDRDPCEITIRIKDDRALINVEIDPDRDGPR